MSDYDLKKNIVTISELESYLVLNGYDFYDMTIGSHYATQGAVIEKEGNKYNFSYKERGEKDLIHSFDTEAELVKYSLEYVSHKEYLVAYNKDIQEILKAESELQSYGIHFERNDIPSFSFTGDTRYRIFVYGTDIFKLTEFKKKHIKY